MFSKRLQELSASISCCSYLGEEGGLTEIEALDRFSRMIAETEGIVYVIGNGGSAGIASHFSNDLMKALQIRSQTLYDSNLMTCLSNDIGYENVFSYPLSHLLRREDLLVAISSSGKSPNILRAVEVALNKGTQVITLSGFRKSNPLSQLGNLNFWIDQCDYGLVEMAHFFLLHTVIDLWNERMGCKHAQVTRCCK
jgi:D-sedoheptulose 7-phosphate isomerase